MRHSVSHRLRAGLGGLGESPRTSFVRRVYQASALGAFAQPLIKHRHKFLNNRLLPRVMAIKKLAHYSIRTSELERSKRFYIDVLGFKDGYRPPLNFPGAWLYLGGDERDYGVVHLLGTGPDDSGLAEYLGDRGPEQGTGNLDHIAFLATDLSETYARLESAGVDFRERTVPSLGLHQVFLEDPSGVTIELNFAAEEAIAASTKRAGLE